MEGCGRHGEGVLTTAVIDAGGAMIVVFKSLLLVVVIGIISGGHAVNNMVSGCLPAVALTATAPSNLG